MDDPRRRVALGRTCFSRDLYEPRGVLQSNRSGSGRGHRTRGPSTAASPASRFEPNGPRAFVAKCAGRSSCDYGCRGGRLARRHFDADNCLGCSRLLRCQRHRRTRRSSQTTKVDVTPYF